MNKALGIALVTLNLGLIIIVGFLLFTRIDSVEVTPEPVVVEYVAPPAQQLDVPVVYIRSGTFTEEERSNLEERVVRTFIDYYSCLGSLNTLVFRIEKSDTPGYAYKIEAMSATGYQGFLQSETKGLVDYYTPDLILNSCIDTLPHADQVRDQAVDEYNG